VSTEQGLEERKSSCVAKSSVTKRWAVLVKLQAPSSIGGSVSAGFRFVEVVELPLLLSSQHQRG